MDRKAFDKLGIQDQVKYINFELQNNISLRKISDSLGIQRKTIRLRFRKAGFDFDMEQNKYISSKIDNKYGEKKEKNTKYKDNTNVIQNNKVGSKLKEEYKNNTNVFKGETPHEIKGEYTKNTNVFKEEDALINDKNPPHNNKNSDENSENSKKLVKENKKNKLTANKGINKGKDIKEYKGNTNVIQNNEVGSKTKKEYKKNTNVFKGETPHKIKDEYTENTNVLQEKLSGEKEEYKSNIIVFNDSTREDLMNLAAAKEDIFKVIEWFNKKQREENIIDVPELKISKTKFNDEVKVTTIRVYSNIKEDFKEFIKKYPEYKSQDIYSQALLEFMNKYNK